MTRRIVLSVLLAGALLAVGVGAYTGLVALRREPPKLDPQRPALSVDAVRLEPRTVVAPVEGFGTARADRLAVLGCEVAGQVVALADDLRDGAAVAEHSLLVRIDDREYRAQLERAESQLASDLAVLDEIDIELQNLQRMTETAAAELEIAEREYTRIRDLLEHGDSSPRELDAARVTLQRARRTLQDLQRQAAVLPARRAQVEATCELRRAEVALARLNVQRCEICAPFAGQVEDVRVEVGEQVGPGQQLLMLLDPDLIEVPIELPVSQRSRIRAGAPARLILESRPHAPWTGCVARVAPSADALSRTFSVFVEVRNAGQRDAQPLMPGMFVRARIDGPTLHDVLLVPRAALRQNRVFICNDARAYARAVEVVEHVLDQAVVRGLEPGQAVITSNLDALYDGAPVNPTWRRPTSQPVGPGRTAPAQETEAP